MASKKIIPFSWLPGSWGLRGKTREIAKAEYELTGYDLQVELLRIHESEYTPVAFKTKHIDLLRAYEKIDGKTHSRMLADLIEEPTKKALVILGLDFKDGKMSEVEYEKAKSTINKEPWVHVLNIGFGGTKSLEGSFELDWNDFFVEDLRAKGYVGPTDDAIVNQWFMEVCRNVAMEEFDGTGDFTSDSAANLETMKRWNSTESFANGRKGYN